MWNICLFVNVRDIECVSEQPESRKLKWQWVDFLITCPLTLKISTGCLITLGHALSSVTWSQTQIWALEHSDVHTHIHNIHANTHTRLDLIDQYTRLRGSVPLSPVTYPSQPPKRDTASVGALSRQEILLVSGPCAYWITTQRSSPSSH